MDQVLKTRAISGVIFGILVIALLLMGKWGVSALLAIVAIGGSYEYNKICGKSTTSQLVAMVLALAVFVLVILVNIPPFVKEITLSFTLFFYVFFSTNVVTDFRLDHTKLLPMLALIYPIAALALPLMYGDEKVWQSQFWFHAILLIWVSDTGAYLVGRKLGKRKLIERVSPGKTIEGSLGAGLFTLIGGLMIGYFSGTYSLVFWIVAALTIWIVGTLGDLYESTIKRKYNVKDSGQIMPGHGGFLDRFDSLIFAAPFLVLIIKIYNLSI